MTTIPQPRYNTDTMNNKAQVIEIPDDLSAWWESLHDLQKKNLSNLVFNRLHDWVSIDRLHLSDSDIKLLYVFSQIKTSQIP